MRRPFRHGGLTLVALLTALFCVSTVSQAGAGITLFDEDDAVGTGYYDASVGVFTSPSSLTLGGPGDKLVVLTNRAFTGLNSGLLQWRSAARGSWNLLIAAPGFKTAEPGIGTTLSLRLNAPRPVSALALPRVGLESTPPDVRSTSIDLAAYLPEGIDNDPMTWQLVEIPLGAFEGASGFSPSRIKGLVFAQGASSAETHTLWFDDVRLDSGLENPLALRPPSRPTDFVAYAGDRSVVLHWRSHASPCHVFRRTGPARPPERLTSKPVLAGGYVDFDVQNGQSYFYSLRTVHPEGRPMPESQVLSATPKAFAGDDAFLEYVQRTAFDYFWYEANPANGLVRDRDDPAAACSVAALGFGLSAIPIGIERGWITRSEGTARVRTALQTLWSRPQGDALTGTTGYRGWFYHFLDLETGLRAGSSELSSIDTALLLAGVLDVRQFFDAPTTDEASIRRLADGLVNRVDWEWMRDGQPALRFGWRPESGFIPNRWVGYNEGMLLYLLGLGSNAPLPPDSWAAWTSGYQWRTNYTQSYLDFGPLFGHQYTQCWVDLRERADAFMQARGLTYFENSRRATLAQRCYAADNPLRHPGYSTNVWGWTACDGPGIAPYLPYHARGIASSVVDDGTIAPTAAGASLPFTPEYSLCALRTLYELYRTNLWTHYGFRDAFNLRAGWWGPHVVGIDQGPILLMAENLRSGHVWQRFMQSPQIGRGLTAAGFKPIKASQQSTPLQRLSFR